MKKRVLWMGLALTAVTAFASPPFEKVPDRALQMLKGAVGKPQDSGLVFANGQYVRPPYRVARMGTAIFINDVQVTDQVNSWRKFLATQPGYVGKVAARAAEVGEAKSLDELFADEEEPEVNEPEQDIAFTPNAKSAALLKEVDLYRAEIQRKLREGNFIFFGSRYARVIVEPRVAKSLLAVLPEAMREAEDGVDLESRLRAKGIVFLNRTVCSDLLEHRPDYLKLVERRKHLKELERLNEISQRNATEVGR